MRSLFWSRGRSRDQGGQGALFLVLWLAAVILAPVLARVIALFISRKREFLADASGAELNRNPLGLASALKKITGYPGPPESYSRGTAALWIAAPLRASRWESLFATHPPVDERVRRLERMAYVRSNVT
jgi:heat shock protein HtpX